MWAGEKRTLLEHLITVIIIKHTDVRVKKEHFSVLLSTETGQQLSVIIFSFLR